jgi:hypothetical protein
LCNEWSVSELSRRSYSRTKVNEKERIQRKVLEAFYQDMKARCLIMVVLLITPAKRKKILSIID